MAAPPEVAGPRARQRPCASPKAAGDWATAADLQAAGEKATAADSQAVAKAPAAKTAAPEK